MLLLAITLALASDPVRIDLDADDSRQVVVDREPGVYLGHVSTVLMGDGRTILAAYPKGHGAGPIVLKRSDDGGLTWSERLPTPQSWETSRETPTLFRLGGDSLILFSGLYPIRAAHSADGGLTWGELSPIGEFGGIVAMGDVVDLGRGRFAAFFHDDGRFFGADGKASGAFTLYQTETEDGGATWSSPRTIWSGSHVHLCEPGVVVSPDAGTIGLLLRENSRTRNSHVMFSSDGAERWSSARELPATLTGDRHIAAYGADGRLVVTYRCMARGDPWRGDWVAWVGSWSDLAALSRGEDAPGDGADEGTSRAPYLVRLKDNLTAWDCGYAGLESLSDGTMFGATYGTWTHGEQPWILGVRFTLEELDRLASEQAAE